MKEGEDEVECEWRVKEKGGCPVTLPLGEREGHASTCSFRFQQLQDDTKGGSAVDNVDDCGEEVEEEEVKEGHFKRRKIEKSTFEYRYVTSKRPTQTHS